MQKEDLPFVLLALGAQYGLQAVSRLLGLAFLKRADQRGLLIWLRIEAIHHRPESRPS